MAQSDVEFQRRVYKVVVLGLHEIIMLHSPTGIDCVIYR